MKRRSWISGGLALLVAGCGPAVGVGGRGANDLASTRIRTSSTSAVRSAVLEVFKEEGFTVVSRSSESVVFTIPGGRRAEIMWSTISNPNPVMIRATVTWRPDGPNRVWVGCQVQVTQKNTAFGETVRQPRLVGMSAYNDLLRRVRRRVEEGR
jgi:hypothetical protein